MKKLLLIVLGLLIFLAAAIVVVPPFINLGAYKARYLPLVEEALGRKVDVGEIRLRIVPEPALRLSGLKVADDPAFSKEPFFAAEQISLRLKLRPLLRGQFQVEEFVLEKPLVNLVKKPDGSFNFSDLGKKKEDGPKRDKKEPPRKTREAARLSEMVPALLSIEDGDITFQSVGQQPLRIRGLDVSLKDFSTDRPFPYRVALSVPGFKPVSLEGQALYRESDATLSLKDNQLTTEDIVLALNGTVADLAGTPRLNLSLANEGFEIKPILQLLAALGITPKQLEVSGPVGLRVTLAGPSNNLASQVRARLKGLKVNDPRALKGTVTGEIQLSAPLGGGTPFAQAMRGEGKITAKDGELTNVDLIKKIEQATGLLGMSKEERAGATTFNTFETDFVLAGGVAQFKRIYLQSPAMEAYGSGQMKLEAQTLDLRIEAALAPGASDRGGKTTAFLKDAQGRLVAPLKVTGPAKNPSVNLDSDKMMKKGLGQMMEKGPGTILEQFFKRR